MWQDTERPPEWTYLIELTQFLGKNSEKAKHLSNILEKNALRLLHLGGYALPLETEDFQGHQKEKLGEANA